MNSLVYIKIDQDIFLDVVFKLHEMKKRKIFWRTSLGIKFGRRKSLYFWRMISYMYACN